MMSICYEEKMYTKIGLFLAAFHYNQQFLRSSAVLVQSSCVHLLSIARFIYWQRNATTVMLALADKPFMLLAHKQAPWLTLERGSVDRFFLPLEVQ